MGTFDQEREKAFPDCCQPDSSESLGLVRHFLEESNCTFPLFNTYPLWRTGDIDEKRHWMGENSALDNCFFPRTLLKKRQVVYSSTKMTSLLKVFTSVWILYDMSAFFRSVWDACQVVKGQVVKVGHQLAGRW